MKSSKQTVASMKHRYDCVQMALLNSRDRGKLRGKSEQEMKAQHAEEYDKMLSDPVNYRFPMGESYADVVERLKPIILELERQRASVLVVAHRSIVRVLYCYFVDCPKEEIFNLDIPLHTVPLGPVRL